MATTISLPTVVTGGPPGFNGINLLADDGINTTGIWSGISIDVRLSEFEDLSVPAGATIEGIEVVVDGQGNSTNFSPLMKVYNGNAWSSALPFQGPKFTKSNVEYDPGWGSSSNLWGLTWNTSTANAIQIEVDCSTIIPAGARIFWDWVRVRVTFSEAESPTGTGLSLGLIQLTSGKISI